MNGNSLKAPPWPAASGNRGAMFLLPKPLASGDEIIIKCKLPDEKSHFSLNLAQATSYNEPDFNNIACQIKASFPHIDEHGEDKISVVQIENGQEIPKGDFENFTASESLADETEIRIKIRGENVVDVDLNGANIQCEISPNWPEVRFLSIHGVEGGVSLNFNFKYIY